MPQYGALGSIAAKQRVPDDAAGAAFIYRVEVLGYYGLVLVQFRV